LRQAFETPFCTAPYFSRRDRPLTEKHAAQPAAQARHQRRILLGDKMLRDISIKKKLYFGFGSIVAIILVLLTLAYNNFSKLSEANGWDRHTLEVLLEANGISNALLKLQSAERGYLLTGDDSYLKQNQDEEANLHQHIEKASHLTADNPIREARFVKIGELSDTWLVNVAHPLIEKRRTHDKSAGAIDQSSYSSLLQQGIERVGLIQNLLDEASRDENGLLAERAKDAIQQQQIMSLVLIVGGVACTAFALILSYLLVKTLLTPLNNLTEVVNKIAAGQQSARVQISSNDELGQVSMEFNRMAQAIQDNQAKELSATTLLKDKVDALLDTVSRATAGDLTGKVTVSGDDAIGQLGNGLARMFENLRSLLNNIQKAGIQVTTSATEIAASAKQQEATGIEQAQTSVEVLSTTKEISANTSQLLKTMEEAVEVADYTTEATADAQNNLKRMDQTMQHMVSATDSINAKLAALSDKASNINSVLITITKVADQTNLLSLNAAIEAEKAGEAGRGFSVVATEIRRLADQTSVATWDIEQMLKEMQSAVSASVMGMDKFSEEIRRSVGEVRQVGEQLSAVIDQVQKLTPRFDNVLQGMQSQSIGASQISETMMQLNDATQQTVESLKATSEAVHQLQFSAKDLQASVANFAVTV
jgi:methyl-accepting chemotaxis protein WspA